MGQTIRRLLYHVLCSERINTQRINKNTVKKWRRNGMGLWEKGGDSMADTQPSSNLQLTYSF